MTIKVRVILGFLLTIAIMAGGTIPYVTSKMRNTAEESYLTASGEQLQLMGSYVEGLINEAERNLAFLAADELLIDGENTFPNYKNTSTENAYKRSALAPEAARAGQPLFRLAKANPSYVEVYVGYPDGSYGSSLADCPVPAGFLYLQAQPLGHRREFYKRW